jgi:hypothetical protein
MLAVGIVPAVLVVCLRTSVPESPRWLASHGHKEAAAEALSHFTGRPSVADATTPAHDDAASAPGPSSSGPAAWRELFGEKFRRRTILACVPWFLMDIATYGVGLFTPVILMSLAFSREGLASGDPFLAREIASVKEAVFLDLFLIVGFALAIVLIDRVGRIPLQLVGFLGMALGLGILAMSGAGASQSLFLVFAGFIPFNLMMNAGPNTTTYVLPSEIFPTRLRATAHGLASASGKVGAALGIFFLPIFQARLGLDTTLLLIGSAAVLGAAVTWLTAIETLGRSLKDFETPYMRP